MSVVVQNSAGWFLDACSLIDQSHSSCIRHSKDGKQSAFKCRFKRQCFRVNKSYCSAQASAVTDGGIASVLPSCDKPPKVIKKREKKQSWASANKQSRLEYCGVRRTVSVHQAGHNNNNKTDTSLNFSLQYMLLAFLFLRGAQNKK